MATCLQLSSYLSESELNIIEKNENLDSQW